MAGTPYLIDSNVLLRWVKADDRDYPLVVSAIDTILQRGAVLCYTSQNVAEFWNTVLAHLIATGTPFLLRKLTAVPGFSRTSYDYCRIVWPSTRNGADCLSRTMSPVFRSTMPD